MLDIASITNQVYFRAYNEHRPFLRMELLSASICCFQMSKTFLIFTNVDEHGHFCLSNHCALQPHQTTPAASLKRRKWGLGKPIRIKM